MKCLARTSRLETGDRCSFYAKEGAVARAPEDEPMAHELYDNILREKAPATPSLKTLSRKIAARAARLVGLK